MSSHFIRLSKVLRNVEFEDCWIWTGDLDESGYGRHSGGSAHAAVYQLFVGPVPSGLELDHLCRNKICVNPEHLEPVTRAENMCRRKVATTHCRNGHEFTRENTRLRPGTTTQLCRMCERISQAKYLTKKRSQDR